MHRLNIYVHIDLPLFIDKDVAVRAPFRPPELGKLVNFRAFFPCRAHVTIDQSSVIISIFQVVLVISALLNFAKFFIAPISKTSLCDALGN